MVMDRGNRGLCVRAVVVLNIGNQGHSRINGFSSTDECKMVGDFSVITNFPLYLAYGGMFTGSLLTVSMTTTMEARSGGFTFVLSEWLCWIWMPELV